MDRLRHASFTLFDTQFLTDHLASLGAQEISRAEYHAQLDVAKRGTARFDAGDLVSFQDVLQRMTQMS